MQKKVLVFDFDGTIADSFPIFVTVFNDLAGEFGYKLLEEKEITLLRQKSAREVFSYLGIPKYKLPFLVRKGRQLLHTYSDALKPIPGIPEALKELQKQKYTLGILTSNIKETVEIFLDRHNIEVFHFVYAKSSIFGKHTTMKHMLRDYHLNTKDVLYVGDEVRDIEAVRKCGLKIISVSWGFNAKEALQKHKPDFLIDTPSALFRLVSGL